MVSEESFQPNPKDQFIPNKPTQLYKTSTTNQTQTCGFSGGTPSVISLALRGESHVKIAVFLCRISFELVTDTNKKYCINS